MTGWLTASSARAQSGSPPEFPAGQTRLERWLAAPVISWIVRAATLLLGALTAWRFRYATSPDTISYMDVSDQFVRHGLVDPHVGYWSPLYPIVIAVFRALLGTGPAHEWPIVHAANFAIFIAAFVAFEYLLRTLAWWIDTDPQRAHLTDAPSRHGTLYAVGQMLFLWCAIGMIGLGVAAADMLVAAAVFTAAALILRLQRGGRWWTAAALGVVLGAGYLAKAVMFPGTLLFLGVLAFRARRDRDALARVALAIGTFALVASPEVLSVSRVKGAPTFGDSGRLNYAWFVGLVPAPFWYGKNLPSPMTMPRPAYIDPVHGVAVDSATGDSPVPILYNVDRPYPGTFPLWYDATRWYPSHISYHVPVRREIYITRTNLWLIVGWCAPLLLGVLIPLVAWGGAEMSTLRVVWTLLLPSLGVIAMYGVMYVEQRYIGPFVLLAILSTVWAAFALPVAGAWTPRALFLRTLRNAVYFMAALQAAMVVYQTAADLRAQQVMVPQRLAIARYVARIVPPGTRVAVIGDPLQSFWARLTRSHVVAFVPLGQSQEFWLAPPATRAAILDSIRALHIPIVVADTSAAAFRTDTAGWSPVPGAPGTLVKRL